MIDGLHGDDLGQQLRIVPADVFDQLGLGVGRSGDEHGAGTAIDCATAWRKA
jgi:hypothetical protein